MCVEASPKTGCQKSSCGCGGHGQAKGRATAADPRVIMALKFGEREKSCACGGKRCPRHYLAYTGFLLAGFLALHFAINALAMWPGKFQSLVSRNHSLGAWLPVLEVGLIFIPLAIHLAFGLRTLRREKLKYGVEKHHHGSDLRQWLQRLTAVILLAFVSFHLVVMHRWFCGRFDPHHAFASASRAVWQFWSGLPAGNVANLLFAQIYLLGIVAAVYHVTNGLATAAEVVGWVRTPAAQERLWRACLCAAPLLLLAGMAAWYALAVN
jgi:succinate dehydrogenase/fumarate reductase cytochrome b subunit